MAREKAFTIVEYSLVIIILVLALLLMRVYMQRAIMGKWKDSIDTISFGRQYERGQ